MLEPDELGPVGQKVERIAEHHGLHVGDDAHLGLVGMDLGLLPDDPGVADSQTVEEVHHDNDDEENDIARDLKYRSRKRSSRKSINRILEFDNAAFEDDEERKEGESDEDDDIEHQLKFQSHWGTTRTS